MCIRDRLYPSRVSYLTTHNNTRCPGFMQDSMGHQTDANTVGVTTYETLTLGQEAQVLVLISIVM